MSRLEEVLLRIDKYRFEIPMTYKQGMRTSGIIYADDTLFDLASKDNALEQVANVATLPGIVGKSLAMPDIHWGYGFPIGGVAATTFEGGVISPGGVGYDINCGVRLLKTNLMLSDIEKKVKELIDALFINVPSGVGSHGKIRLDERAIEDVLRKGARWGVESGYGWEEDIEHIEEKGCMEVADPSKVSWKAKQRGAPQLGTLGAGNHFLEIQIVEEIYEPEIAKKMGIYEKNQIMVMIHTGSRGCGHQICTDALEKMRNAVKKYDIILPDKQLACAPTNSIEADEYFKAMACGANYAWANRQMISHWVREGFEKVLGRKAEELDLKVIYDVAHNIAKIEEHEIDGKRRKLYVHRKGATRAFPKGHKDVPADYSSIGQPVLIPGDMGRASYVLVGTERAMKETFGSTCHGAGRVMSREAAIRKYRDEEIVKRLRDIGIYAKGASRTVLAEEAPEAYKDISKVVDVTHGAGLSIKVAKLRPIGVMKG
ncbi:MAG: RtcB family protein [Candidatus Thermoplasmatota archaeon]